MIMAITADLHLNNSVYGVMDKDTGLPIRTVDSLKALSFFVDSCIEKKIDRAVIAGDVYDTHAPVNTVQRLFNRQVQKLVAAKIQVVIMVGNHDTCDNHHALMPSEGWNKLVKVVDKEIVEITPTYSCIYVPHTIDVQRGVKTFPQIVNSVVQDRTALTGPVVFFGHFAVNGSVSNDYHVHSSRTDAALSDILATGAQVAFLGHFHKFQRLECDIPAYYVGSLERHNMTDTSTERGFTIFNTETMEIDRVLYTGYRPMKKIYSSSYDEAMKEITDGTDWTGYIARIDFAGEKTEYAEIKRRAGDLRREFKARGGLHIYMQDVKYGDDEKTNQSGKVETIDQLDIRSMINKNIEADFPEGEERSIYLTMADSLWKEAVKV
jgi:DNA repair exonuclease SbcCD nuclease subunit